MGLLLELLFETLLEVFGQLLLELGWAGVKEALGRRNHNPVLATFGYLVLGSVVGGATVWLHPGRVLSSGPVPGLSVVLSPILCGTAMHFWGEYRRRQGHDTTNLATFYGGAAFAFAVSLARFMGTR